MIRDRVLLVDGNNLLFRMFFGMPNKIYDSKGVAIHGIVGFIGSVIKLVNQYVPNYIVVVFDSEISSEKFKDTNYKKNRITDFSEVPDYENPYSQLADIKKCLDYIGISYIEREKCEADDIIATICKQIKKLTYEIIIVSTDKDYFQLVDANTKVLCLRGESSILYDEYLIEEKFGVLPEQYVSYCSLVGDKADNISGIKGIGKVTASKLINEYRDIPNIYANISSLSHNISQKLEGQLELIKTNLYLITMNSNLDFKIELENYLIDIKKFKNIRTMNIISLAR